jgi:hypothetical protein
VESELSQGSSFRFTIPRKTPTSDPQPGEPGEMARSA